MDSRISEAIMIQGGAGTGKSSHVIERAAALLEAGTPSNEILILAASPDAANVLARKLEAKAGPSAREVTVTVPRALALQILDGESARAQTGRDARILTPFEYNIAMEDLKVSGLRPQRLKEMVKFLFRGWSELRHDEPGWLINSQERGLVAMLTECADSNRCYFDVEVTAAAARHLVHDDSALNEHVHAYVLVDDYTSLSRASQLLAGLLASHLLCVTCDPTIRATVFEQYPYAEGANEFLELHPNAQKVQLTKSVLPQDTVVGINNVTSDAAYLAELDLEAVDPNAKGIQTLSFDEPNDELDAIAQLVGDEIARGRNASDIYIASPSKAWSSHLVRKLGEAGLPVCANNLSAALSGDVRDLASCQAPLVFTLLQLCANPGNPAAIRSWCGFGDHLARSGEFESLRAHCKDSGISLSEALGGESDRLGGLSTEPISRLRALHAQALRIVDAACGLTGNALLETLARSAAEAAGSDASDMRAVASIATICGPVKEADTAETLLGRAYTKLALPQFPRENAVRVGGLTDAYGLEAPLVICSGMVNGLIPCVEHFDRTAVTAEKQALLYRKGLESFHALLSAAPGSLTFTYFQSILLLETKRIRVRVDRIRLDRQKRRLCLVSPSIYLEKLDEQR
ncbi:MAG: AAA family ATPase [Eggerthellaceae bacterium]|nr:AAA family ATPase [Eggerthellaceae bacterium]